MNDRNNEIRIIQYLGSKVNILPYIGEEITRLVSPGGTILDIFSGTGVVGQSLKDRFTIISNDIQEYSFLINKLLLEFNDLGLLRDLSIAELYESEGFKENYRKLEQVFCEQLKYEDSVINNDDLNKLSLLCQSQIFYNGSNIRNTEPLLKQYYSVMSYFSDINIKKYRENASCFPYMLFSLYYLNSYFSLRQCIEIDSLRYSIDCLSKKQYDGDVKKQIYLVCLLHAISEVVSTVGKHFAQPIKTVDKNNQTKEFITRRCLRDRKRNIIEYMEKMLFTLKNNLKIGNYPNKVYCMEYRDILDLLRLRDVDLVYIDPPYTIDHYSRFYHIPETLVKYDYPELEYKIFNGKNRIMQGRYRTDRFQSNFCIPSKAYNEFDVLIHKVRELNTKIVMSYSEGDCKKETRSRVIDKDTLLEIIRKYYDDIEVININHKYRKLNKKENNKEELDNSELLLICK